MKKYKTLSERVIAILERIDYWENRRAGNYVTWSTIYTMIECHYRILDILLIKIDNAEQDS